MSREKEIEIENKMLEPIIEEITKMMEEMAGKPKEPLRKRQSGEKCLYERTSAARMPRQAH